MVEVSTDGSDEEYLTPGPTLSYPIPVFYTSGHVLDNLALNREYRKVNVWPKLVKLLSLR